MNKELEEKIDKEIIKHYGDRYYDEYHHNSVTAAEFEKVKSLVYRCVEIAEEGLYE